MVGRYARHGIRAVCEIAKSRILRWLLEGRSLPILPPSEGRVGPFGGGAPRAVPLEGRRRRFEGSS
jgi:hypothetical protein